MSLLASLNIVQSNPSEMRMQPVEGWGGYFAGIGLHRQVGVGSPQ